MTGEVPGRAYGNPVAIETLASGRRLCVPGQAGVGHPAPPRGAWSGSRARRPVRG